VLNFADSLDLTLAGHDVGTFAKMWHDNIFTLPYTCFSCAVGRLLFIFCACELIKTKKRYAESSEIPYSGPMV